MDRPCIACFPLYPPVELFHALGLTPVVLWSVEERARPMHATDKHVQNFACLLSRALVNAFLQEGAGRYAGVFSYNACDTLRNLPEIIDAGMQKRGARCFSSRIHVPASHLDKPFAQAYLNREISQLVARLEETFSVSFSHELFKKSVDLYREARSIIMQLGKVVASGGMRFETYSELVHESYLVPVEQSVHRLKAAIDKYAPLCERKPGNGTSHRAILSGILPPSGPACRIIEEAGFIIVGNDIASMHRSVQHTPARYMDAGSYYVDFYLHHFPCPTLFLSASRRMETLTALVEENKADCVIFIGEKFCEYEYFEIPYLMDQMRAKGIKTMLLEISGDENATLASIKGRVEAFHELLRNP